MRYKTLGRSGLQVSVVALGTATFGVAPLAADADRLVGRAIELGINMVDTANSYGNFPRFDRPGVPPAAERQSAEAILGQALMGRRGDVILCSKVMEPVGPGPNDWGLSRRHIFAQIEESLRRLKTDHLDIYHAHHPDPRIPLDETLQAFDDLVRQGKTRYFALSTFGPSQMTEALWMCDKHSLAKPVLNQIPYSLAVRNADRDMLPAVRRFGIGLTCFSPFGGGLLTGPGARQRSVNGAQRWGGAGFSSADHALAERLEAVAAKHGFQPAELALGWLLSRGGVSSAIIGPETVEELEINVAAATLDIPAEAIDEVDEIGRLPFAHMAM